MKKIKIAQIGTSLNGHGQRIFDSLKKQTDIFEIAGVAFPENEKEKFPQLMGMFDGYRELTVEEILNDPEIEAVIIETEEIYLTKYSILAAQHNKNIHMEKPGGTDLAEFEKLISLVKRNNLVFHIGYMYRYNSFVIELLKQVKNGDLGEIISVEAQMNCSQPLVFREWLKSLKGGMMFYLGCHLIDIILQIQGAPEKIIPLNKATMFETDSEDFGMAVFEYKNGISFAKAVAIERGGFARRQLVVTGTKKTVELKPFEMHCNPQTPNVLYTNKIEYNEEGWYEYGTESKSEVYDRYDTMMKTFSQMVTGERENKNTPDYELMLYKTILTSCGIDR
ncbi:MAG: Gfo/Idh/MocA family oxidoreductase [Clostridia bacterium]|nr:Gfo/Idh/MocA family oxidoreductase [Clostridia bacterium]